MRCYRKKPVVVQAMTFDEFIEYGIASGAPLTNGKPWSFDINGRAVTQENDDCYLICTLEGAMRFSRGEMLIIGVQGEAYPCKADIFEATYEEDLTGGDA